LSSLALSADRDLELIEPAPGGTATPAPEADDALNAGEPSPDAPAAAERAPGSVGPLHPLSRAA
jgi:hypothetical protein